MALSHELDAYAAYVNSVQRAFQEFGEEELAEFLEDFAKAKAALEVAWLEQLAQAEANPRVSGEDSYGWNSGWPFDPEIGWTTDCEGGW